MSENNPLPQKENIADALQNYQNHIKQKGNEGVRPETSFNKEQFENVMSKETDPDLMMGYELIPLPSEGKYYHHGISEVQIEYMTSKDEDLLTTPSLIDSGKVIDLLLKRKIKTKGINIHELLPGDRNAIILFLRTSSYGHQYKVEVTDPRTGKIFPAIVNLLELRYKIVEEKPDEHGYFTVELPMRKKVVKIRLLSAGEEKDLFKQAESIKEAYNQEFNEYSTMKLKACIVSIGGNNNRDYISKFVDVMPALDAYSIRRKILDVSPDVDMEYEFTTPDGYKFKTILSVGLDFFSPSI